MSAKRPRDWIDLTALDPEPWPRAGATSSLDALLAPTFGPPVLARAWADGGGAHLDVATGSGARIVRLGCPLAPASFEALARLAIAALSEEPPRDWVIRDGIRLDLDVSHAGTAGWIESPLWSFAPIACELTRALVDLALPLTQDAFARTTLERMRTAATRPFEPREARGRRR